MSEQSQGEGAGEQEPKGTRHGAGMETPGQPQAMRADALTFCRHCARSITYHPFALDVMRWQDDTPHLIHEPLPTEALA